MLQSENDPGLVAQFFPSESTARVTCSKVRKKYYGSETDETSSFVILEQQKEITINQEKQPFLRFDNQDKHGNRILIKLCIIFRPIKKGNDC